MARAISPGSCVARAWYEPLHQPGVVGVHGRLVRESDAARLVVCPLAQPNSTAGGENALDVGSAPPQRRLDHDARLRVCLVSLLPQGQSGVRAGMVLHIEADEAVDRPGGVEDPHHVGEAQLRVDLHAHLGQLHADVRVQAAGREGGQGRDVPIGGGGGEFRRGDGFAQDVDRGAQPGTLQVRDGGQGRLERLPGDEARDDRPRQRTPDGQTGERPAMRQRDEERSHGSLRQHPNRIGKRHRISLPQERRRLRRPGARIRPPSPPPRAGRFRACHDDGRSPPQRWLRSGASRMAGHRRRGRSCM